MTAAKADTNPLREALEQAHEILRGPHYQGGASLMAIGQAFGVLDAALASEPVAGTDDLRHALQRMADHDPADPAVSYDRLELLVASAAQAAKNALAALSAPPAPAGRERTDEEIDERLAKQEARDNLRLLDFIADKIGLPHNEELSRGNFLAWQSSLTPQAGATTASAPERTMVVGRNTKILHEGDQCHGMPHAICHACGLGYKCFNADCPNDKPNPMFATPPVPGAADRATVVGECASVVGKMRQSEAGLFDAKHSGQRGRDRADALYDAYIAIRSLATDLRIEAAFSRAERGVE